MMRRKKRNFNVMGETDVLQDSKIGKEQIRRDEK